MSATHILLPQQPNLNVIERKFKRQILKPDPIILGLMAILEPVQQDLWMGWLKGRLGGATVLLLDQEADSAVGRQPRPRGATPKHVQLQLQLRGRHADQCLGTDNIATM